MTVLLKREVSRNLSRRRFLALCGKLSVGLAVALTGASATVLKVYAACCVGTPCIGCQNPPAICPTGYAPGTTYLLL